MTATTSSDRTPPSNYVSERVNSYINLKSEDENDDWLLMAMAIRDAVLSDIGSPIEGVAMLSMALSDAVIRLAKLQSEQQTKQT